MSDEIPTHKVRLYYPEDTPDWALDLLPDEFESIKEVKELKIQFITELASINAAIEQLRISNHDPRQLQKALKARRFTRKKLALIEGTLAEYKLPSNISVAYAKQIRESIRAEKQKRLALQDRVEKLREFVLRALVAFANDDKAEVARIMDELYFVENKIEKDDNWGKHI